MAKKQDDSISVAELFRGLSERLKLQAERPNIYGYMPHDKQIQFHSASRRHRLYIGGNRSGKTTGGIAEDIMWLTGRHPYRKVPQGGVRGRIVGVDFIQGVEKILKPEMMRWVPVSDLRGNSWSDAYDVQERTLHFENGSFVEFMSYDQDVDKFAGTSRHFVHFDEEPPEDIYHECMTRLIDTAGSWWMTLTPVMGMEWMYDTVYLPGINDPESNISVIEVDMTENPYLDPNEIREYIKNLPEDDVDARQHGKFVRRGGVVYKSFDKGIHVVPSLEEVPTSWELYASLDHGYNNPTAWLYHGVDSDGNVITFAEHYESEMIVSEHAEQIKLINKSIGRNPGIYVGDPAIAQRQAVTGTSIQTEYAQNGIFITLGNNDVLSGINKVNTYLSHDIKNGKKPRWVITENCVNLIREIQKYRWKTWASKKSERSNNKFDVPHKKDDHAVDSARYFFTLMPDLTPIKPIDPPPPSNLGFPEGRDIHVPRYDKNSKSGQTKIDGDWFIQGADEYMGGEW